MSEPISVVVLSTGLENFKDIRKALTAEPRVKLLAGGNDTEQLYEEIVRLKPAAAIIALHGANADQAVKFIEKLNRECPETALISAAQDASPDLILRSLRAGAREFLRIPISVDELRTVLDRISDFCTQKVETPKKKGRMVAVFSSKGGCGTSFIATNLAAATNSKTILVDLNVNRWCAFGVVIRNSHFVTNANRGSDIRQQKVARSLVFFRIAVTNKITVQMFSQPALLANGLG